MLGNPNRMQIVVNEPIVIKYNNHPEGLGGKKTDLSHLKKSILTNILKN